MASLRRYISGSVAACDITSVHPVRVETSSPGTFRNNNNKALVALLPEAGACTVPSTCSEIPMAEILAQDDPDSRGRFARALSCYSDDSVVEAHATLAQQLDLYSTSITPSQSNHDTHAITYGRPEFIYCQVLKPDADASVGITLESHQAIGAGNPHTFVSKIANDGLLGELSSHYVRPGDVVLSVNGKSTMGMDATEIAALLRSSRDKVSVTVRNPRGDPRTVASTVQRPVNSSRIGVSVLSDRSGTYIQVKDVHADSLFADSLLVTGHRCLEINGRSCKGMAAAGAVECLRQNRANRMITIVSHAPTTTKSSRHRAAVLCIEPDQQLRRRRRRTHPLWAFGGGASSTQQGEHSSGLPIAAQVQSH